MRRPFSFALAAAVPLLLYARTASFDFVHADDVDLIVGNQAFLSDLRNVPRAFERSYFEVEGELTAQKTYYRPVAIVSFMLDAARGGASAGAYHATNVALHAAASALMMGLALSWGAAPGGALIAALLFAVHPVNVQAVAWVAGRNDLLLAVFGLGSVLAWAAGRTAVWALAIHVAAFGLALFAKETGVAFPILAALHQRTVARHLITRAQWIALALDAALIVAWSVLRARALGEMTGLSAATFGTVVTNLPQLLVHAGKMLLPLRLNVSPAVAAPDLLLGGFALGVLAWIAWRTRRRVAILAVAWMLLFLLPTLVVPGLPVYEHRAYLPLLGALTIMPVGLAGRPVAFGRSRLLTGRQIFGCLVCIAGFAALTFHRQQVFRDPFAYWTDGARDEHFGPIAHVNLGQLYEAGGRPADARREYLRALARDPHTPKAHNNLGVVLMTLNEPELALTHFKAETVRHRWNADGWFNLGLWHELRGNTADARRYYERAIEANPQYVPAYEKLGRRPPV